MALLVATGIVLVLYWDTTPTKVQYLDDGIKRASMIIANTAAVVGFGTVVKSTVGFQTLVDGLANLGGNPLISFGVATTLVAGATGSGSGGIGITACGMSHKESYKPIFITSVCITLIGLAVAIFLGIVLY